MNRAWIFAMLVSCGGAVEPPAAPPGTPNPGGADESGNAGRIVCEAECARRDRCGKAATKCLARCAKIPDRDPPIWSAGWARVVAACIDASDCTHDSDEACATTTRWRSVAGDACRAKPGSAKSVCALFDGLTSWAADDAKACLDAGGTVSECMPTFDWK